MRTRDATHPKTPIFDAVIFDLDGLMLDTETIYSATSRRASGELDFTFDDAYYRANFVGRKLADSEALLVERFGAHFPLAAYRALSERYLREALAAGARPKPRLIELLDWLDARGIPKSVATSTVRDLARLTLGPLAARFPLITTGDEVANGKPAADIFLLAASRLKKPAGCCVVLEDSSAGVRAAHTAGAIPIWVPDLQTPTPELRALAWRVCESLREVLGVLKARLDGSGAQPAT
jgi:HAD superfamily hydrolase (TIGR01509 family)